MIAIDEHPALTEQRRRMKLVTAISWGGLIMAAFGLGSYLADPDQSRGVLVWVALGAALGVGLQLKLLRQMMRGKDKGTA